MWTPLLGTALVVSLMAYTTKLVFWDADKEEREWQRGRAQRQAGAAGGSIEPRAGLAQQRLGTLLHCHALARCLLAQLSL